MPDMNDIDEEVFNSIADSGVIVVLNTVAQHLYNEGYNVASLQLDDLMDEWKSSGALGNSA